MFLKFIPREGELIDGKSSIYFDQFNMFTYSRDAIYEIANQIGLNENDEVIIPNYICSTVIDTLHMYTKNITQYTIDERLKFNEDELRSLMTDKTKMVIFVDYFGVEANVTKEFVEILQENNITLLKDSAHSFLTLLKNDFHSNYRYDYLVTSIYKNLPLYAGAIAIGDFEKNTNL